MHIHAFAPILLDIELTAFYLSVSTRTVEKLQRLNEIQPRAIGSKRLYYRPDLDDFAANLPEWVEVERNR